MDLVVEEVKNRNNETDSHQSDPTSRRFSNAGDAVKELFEGFNDWSATVSSYGIQMAYAVIAANWAVYGDAQAIIGNIWAKYSIAIVISFLGLNLFCTWLMTSLYDKRCAYADVDKARWSSEFEREKISPSAWPYTKFIEKLGKFMRLLKVWTPIVGGIVFIIGLFCGGQTASTVSGQVVP
jgi:hypothetical protein